MNKILEEFGNIHIHELKQPGIEDWLGELEVSPRTKRNYLTTLTTFLGWSKQRGYTVENVAEHMPRPILDEKPVGILTIDEAKELLNRTQKCPHSGMLPLVAIGLFAGLRRSELCALDWSEVNLARKLIEVKASKAKTRQRRLVTISDNLAIWLAPFGKTEGSVGNLSINHFGKHLRELVNEKFKTRPGERIDLPHIRKIKEQAKPIQKHLCSNGQYPHNGLRHSFGSYHFAHHQNENKTAAEMGNSPQMLLQHYRELVSPEEAAKYWAITPSFK